MSPTRGIEPVSPGWKQGVMTTLPLLSSNLFFYNTLVPHSYATPSYAIFAAMLFWIGSKEIRVKLFSSFSPQLHYFFTPSYSISSFFPQLSYFFCTLDALNMNLQEERSSRSWRSSRGKILKRKDSQEKRFSREKILKRKDPQNHQEERFSRGKFLKRLKRKDH